jgi:[protein-PII] uridylyltransferase
VDELLKGRRRARITPPKVRVKPRVDFDEEASSHSTLTQVVAQDTPGLLRALTHTLALSECNIEVALIDTEGETAIDVFYLTKGRARLDKTTAEALRKALLAAIEANEQESVR